MEELVNTVQAKTGLSHDQAMAAAQAVLDFIMTKVPPPVAGQIKSAIEGGGNVGDMAKGLGGMFGKG